MLAHCQAGHVAEPLAVARGRHDPGAARADQVAALDRRPGRCAGHKAAPVQQRTQRRLRAGAGIGAHQPVLPPALEPHRRRVRQGSHEGGAVGHGAVASMQHHLRLAQRRDRIGLMQRRHVLVGGSGRDHHPARAGTPGQARHLRLHLRPDHAAEHQQRPARRPVGAVRRPRRPLCPAWHGRGGRSQCEQRQQQAPHAA
jgi:hypothetical protein